MLLLNQLQKFEYTEIPLDTLHKDQIDSQSVNTLYQVTTKGLFQGQPKNSEEFLDELLLNQSP